MIKKEFEDLGYETFVISAATGQGLDQLISRCTQLLDEIQEPEPLFDLEPEEEVLYTADFDDEPIKVTIENTRDGRVFVVDGDFERLINSVNFDDLDSVGYFQRKLADRGVFKKLEEMGIQEEELVRLQDIEFEYFK